MSPQAGGDRGDARSVRRDHRDRARAVRGVHSGRVPRRHRRPALPAVRGHGRDRGRHLGLRRADADAGAVRAAAASRSTSTTSRCSGRSTAASRGSTQRFLARRATWRCSTRVAALLIFAGVIGARGAAVLARARRASCRPRTRATSSASIMLPDGATLQRTGEAGAELQQMLAGRPGGRARRSSITGFDLIGGGNKTNAATMFIPLKPWDERNDDAPQTSPRTCIAKRGSDSPTAWCSRSTRRRSAAWAPPAASRSTCRSRGDADPQRARRRSLQRFHRRAAASIRSSPASTRSIRADRAAAPRRGRSREGARARRAGQRRVRRAAEHDGRALRQRLQQVRPHLPRADAGRGAVSRAARRPRQRLRALADHAAR